MRGSREDPGVKTTPGAPGFVMFPRNGVDQRVWEEIAVCCAARMGLRLREGEGDPSLRFGMTSGPFAMTPDALEHRTALGMRYGRDGGTE